VSGKHRTIADEMDDQALWHKVVGALLVKFGDQNLNMADFAPIEGKAVVIGTSNEGRTITLRLMSNAEAERLAADFQRSADRRG